MHTAGEQARRERTAPIAHVPPRTSDWQSSMWYSFVTCTLLEDKQEEREKHLLRMCHPVEVIGRALCGTPLSHAHCWRTSKKRAAPIAHVPPRTSDWQNSMWYSSSRTSDCMRTDTRSSSAEWACWHFTPCGQCPASSKCPV